MVECHVKTSVFKLVDVFAFKVALHIECKKKGEAMVHCHIGSASWLAASCDCVHCVCDTL